MVNNETSPGYDTPRPTTRVQGEIYQERTPDSPSIWSTQTSSSQANITKGQNNETLPPTCIYIKVWLLAKRCAFLYVRFFFNFNAKTNVANFAANQIEKWCYNKMELHLFNVPKTVASTGSNNSNYCTFGSIWTVNVGDVWRKKGYSI